MTICYVLWRDACQEDSATGGPVSDQPLVDLQEVGWLIGETDESLSIAMELEADGTTAARWRLHIPKVNILERRNFDMDALLAKRPPVRKRKTL